MKLAIVRQRYTAFGGAERFVDLALDALRDTGVETTLVTRRWHGEWRGPVITVAPFYLGRLWRDAGFSRHVQQLIAERRFDLVQSHERIPGCAIYRAGDGVHATWLSLRARFAGGASRIADRYAPYHRYLVRTEERMFRHPELRAVICNSNMVADDIHQRFGVPRAGLPGDELWIVGTDRHAERYRRLAQRCGVADRVRFLGPQQDVVPYLGAADVFVLPSWYDPFPNAGVEAFACGLPVVASSTTGTAEFIRPGINGDVCAANDVDDLIRALLALRPRLSDLAIRQAAAATVAELRPDSMVQRFVGLYRSLAE
ncbi:MAG: glycosyltransferase family 4 protein, partial [Rhodocyclales bacterium]|nr:glycosyltransferase family 4 protein [Rhodocyclales bacterium]